jgi:hypothetical protein
MDVFIMVNIKEMMIVMVQENILMVMVIQILDNGNMDRELEKEFRPFLVTPSQRKSFETFAIKYYSNNASASASASAVNFNLTELQKGIVEFAPGVNSRIRSANHTNPLVFKHDFLSLSQLS